MKTSDSIAKLAPALLKAQRAITFAGKNAVNAHFRSNYADLPSVIDAVKPALNEAGISFIQSGSPSEDGRLHLTTRLLHESGEWIEDTAVSPLSKADPQGFGSAMTYLRRYSLAAICGLYQDDDDGEAASRPKQDLGPTPPAWPEKPVQRDSSPAPASAPRTSIPVARPASNGQGWRSVPVPKFMESKGKYTGMTLGDMTEEDLLWWAARYEPKPWNGKIQAKDIALRAALDQAQDELHPVAPPARNEPTPDQEANLTNADQDVPF